MLQLDSDMGSVHEPLEMSILYYYSITGLSLQVFVIGHLVSYRHSTHYDQSLILYNSFMKQVSSVKGDFYVLLLS